MVIRSIAAASFGAALLSTAPAAAFDPFEIQDGKYAGVKLRTKIIAPERGHLRLAINFEVSRVPAEGWGGEIRPYLF
jgi:hypothetical protein